MQARDAAIALWQSIPAVCRQCAKAYTDYWEAYVNVIGSPKLRSLAQTLQITSWRWGAIA